MRKLLIIIFSLILTDIAVSAQIPVQAPVQSQSTDSTSQWGRANKFYMDGDYTSAILLYEEILSSHRHSAQVYYNLGNAYYKKGNIGKAILNYNRALQLDPSDEDIKHNLMIAQARTIDKIEPVPQFFIKQWFTDLGGILDTDMWATLALIFLGITLGGVVVWLISSTITLRKAGFYIGMIGAFITIASLIYSQVNYRKQTSTTEAVIMNTAAPVKSAPSSTSKDLFLLHEGTKVSVLQNLDDWSEITLEDGNKGWILRSAIEHINN